MRVPGLEGVATYLRSIPFMFQKHVEFNDTYIHHHHNTYNT